MYALSEQQVDFILNDIKIRGVEMEDLQLNLLDHICCIIECELEPDGNFENFYQKTIPKFFKKELKEIEEETVFLLTFKHYYAMKKTMIISGAISVTALILGSFFKILHYPGAGVLLVLGVGIISFIFLPLMFLLKTKDNSSKRDKLILAIGSLVGMLYCLSTLFAVMHWPGATILWLTTIGMSGLVLIPVYFFTGIRNPETKVNTIVTSILLVGATSCIFIMVNIRPAYQQTLIKIHTYIQSDNLLKKMQGRLNDTIKNNELVADINTTCEQIKSLIIENGISQTSIPEDFENKNIILEEGNLGIDFFDNGKGTVLFFHLKKVVNEYNSKTNEENKIPVDHLILTIEMDKIGRYSNFSVLNNITQLQMFLANAESGLTASK